MRHLPQMVFGDLVAWLRMVCSNYEVIYLSNDQTRASSKCYTHLGNRDLGLLLTLNLTFGF